MHEDVQYQIAFLGKPKRAHFGLKRVITEKFISLGIDLKHLRFLSEADLNELNPKSPFAAVFFGYANANKSAHPEMDRILRESWLVLPLVDDLKKYTNQTPVNIHHINGMETTDWEHKAANLILEYFRLLRRKRRLFISYKRTDSEQIALQLYAELDRRGYDVFLDTRSVPPGDNFQDELWHRMADSDVVVLLDSPQFKTSPWTQLEYERAHASRLQIVHVLWPTVQPTSLASLSVFLPLETTSFSGSFQTGTRARLDSSSIGIISDRVEQVRAAALAARNRALIDSCCDLARDLNLEANLQPNLSIRITKPATKTTGSKELAIVPMVGVPNALRIDRMLRSLSSLGSNPANVWALYDDQGLLNEICSHLDWLNGKLPADTVSVYSLKRDLQNL